MMGNILFHPLTTIRPSPPSTWLFLFVFCLLCRNTVPLFWQSCAHHLIIRMPIGENLGPLDPSSAPMWSRPGPKLLCRLSRSTGLL